MLYAILNFIPMTSFCHILSDIEKSFTLIPRTGFSGPWTLPRQSSVTEAEAKSFREYLGFYQLLVF